MNPFELRPIGDTGISVTALGLGGAPLSGMVLSDGLFGGVGRNQAIELITAAHKLGIKYFDTAPVYGDGRSEVRLGHVLSNIPREDFVISTKVGIVLDPDPIAMNPTKDDDGLGRLIRVNTWKRDGVLRSINDSLRRLNLDYVDIVYMHGPNTKPFGEKQSNTEGFPTLIELREQGLIKAIGCGMDQWEMGASFIKRFDLDIVLLAGRYTLLDHSGLSHFLPLCEKNNVKVAIGGPFNSGILAKNLTSPVSYDYKRAPLNLVERAKRINSICIRYNIDLKAAALQFVYAHPSVVTVIPGVESVGELKENISLSKKSIPKEFWRELQEQQLIPKDAPTPDK